MPTGYTADLEKDYDVKRWIKETIARSMGMCVILRDEGYKTTAQILDILKGEREELYHARKLRESIEKLALMETFTPERWGSEWLKAVATARQNNLERAEEYERKKSFHLRSMGEVQLMLSKAEEKVRELKRFSKDTKIAQAIVSTLQVARDQLNQSFAFDFGQAPYRDEDEDKTLEQWKNEELEGVRRNIEHHTAEAKQEGDRTGDRVRCYQALVDFVEGCK
jgi:hypothetical protein